jgi:hypothetical protein
MGFSGACIMNLLLSSFMFLFVSHVDSLRQHSLPDGPIILGYQNWGACDRNDTITAVTSGVNVVVWFAVNLVSSDGVASIVGGPDPDCMASVASEIDHLGLETVHLISIGGWDAPHPDSSFSGQEYFDAFSSWNQALPRSFDGFDWDLEGNDDVESPWNMFSATTLNQMVDMSLAAKTDGYIVTLVPAQSYLDVSSSEFSLSLLNAYDDWHPEFAYHGFNVYAYLIAVCPSGTFDLVTIQLYESWSRADQVILNGGNQSAQNTQAYLREWWADLAAGWEVDFGSGVDLRVNGVVSIVVPPSQLIVGLSRGDAEGKSAFIWPEDCGSAFMETPVLNRPRGFGFWNIVSEGDSVNGTNATLAFSPTLNNFLHVR